jgi:hypothetical protein
LCALSLPLPRQPADSLEIYKDDEYIIGDRDLLVNRHAPCLS